VVVIGEHEEYVPRPFLESFVGAAVRAGDSARLIVIPRAGHFEIASPRASAWPQVQAVIRSLLDAKTHPAIPRFVTTEFSLLGRMRADMR
jgi:hypothetical protein